MTRTYTARSGNDGFGGWMPEPDEHGYAGSPFALTHRVRIPAARTVVSARLVVRPTSTSPESATVLSLGPITTATGNAAGRLLDDGAESGEAEHRFTLTGTQTRATLGAQAFAVLYTYDNGDEVVGVAGALTMHAHAGMPDVPAEAPPVYALTLVPATTSVQEDAADPTFTATLTMDGAPVEGATLALASSAAGVATVPASGTTDASGQLVVTAALQGPGETTITATHAASGATDSSVLTVEPVAADCNVIALGNSKTFGASDPDNDWVAQAAGNFPATWTWTNQAINAQRLTDMLAAVATQVTANKSNTRRNVYVVFEYRNEVMVAPTATVADARTTLAGYLDAIRAQANSGDRIIVVNEPSDLNAEASLIRDDMNAAIAAEVAAQFAAHADTYLADLDADAELGDDGDYASTEYFTDGVHLTPAGQARIAHHVSLAIATATGEAYTPAASITLAPVSASVDEGATQQFTATVLDASSNVLAGRWVAWSTAATGTATTTQSGLVTGVAAGSTTLRAYSGIAKQAAALTINAVSGLPGGAVLDFDPAYAAGIGAGGAGTHRARTGQDFTLLNAPTLLAAPARYTTDGTKGLDAGDILGSTLAGAAWSAHWAIEVNAGDIAGGGAFRRIGGKDDATNRVMSILLDGANTLYVGLWGSGGYTPRSVFALGLTVGRHVLSVVYDEASAANTAGRCRVYLDGVEKATDNASVPDIVDAAGAEYFFGSGAGTGGMAAMGRHLLYASAQSAGVVGDVVTALVADGWS